MAVVTGTNVADTLDGTAAADRLSGLAGDDTLNGLAGNDTLDGGTGADVMNGGEGDDLYIVDDIGDAVNENASEGRDRVQASISYTLTANVEDLTLTGTAAIDATGNALANTIVGNKADNRIDGGAGADYMDGGAGNDTYVVDDEGDVIKDASGVDTVEASVSYTVGKGIENLILTGTADINGAGNTSVNTLIGNSGNNTLNGDKGKDTMIGGAGDDTYIVDIVGDVVIEQPGEGSDTIMSSIAWTLGSDIENLTLTGSGRINGTGNALDNILVGNTGDNIMIGAAGNDTLAGGGGKDTLIGGIGDDTYVVSDTQTVITELAGEGTDTLQTSVTHTLMANVENLVLTGTESINGTGNALDNVITGNDAANTLDGGAGADTMAGGLGNDVYIVDNVNDLIDENVSEGIDTVYASVSYTLSDDLENLVLTGAADVNATGNNLDNTLAGNAGINTLSGGIGSDTYIIRHSGTIIVENADEGVDTIEAGFNYTLGANLENLILAGTGNFTATGNSAANLLTGNTGNNLLDGLTGADTMAGGTGDDIYYVEDVNDVIVEKDGEGEDTVYTSISYFLSEGVEHLTLTGTDDISGTGNALDNIIIGNSGNNTLDGGASADILIGGDGDDTYIVDDLGDALVDTGGVDTVNGFITWRLETGFEHLVLVGTADIDGYGNTADNSLTGNSGNNTLDGDAGADTMAGGAGDDTYVVDNIGDEITENLDEGSDTVISSISYTLGANLENLRLNGVAEINATGNALDNTLIGNSAVNTLIGGDGDDTYGVDNIDDVVIEQAGGGIDTIRASISLVLTAQVENLVLTGISAISGTGNALDNAITGNDGVNTLGGGAGNDTLDGGIGDDIMVGGTGDDTYFVDSVNDILTEQAGEGTDEVHSAISWTLGDHLENLLLLGDDDISGTGNSLNNIIIGNTGDNRLDGGAGADVMNGGGSGDDVFIVDNIGDTVIAGSGHDTVYSSVNWVMGANEDELILTGNAVTAAGNAADNIITGNAAANVISGDDGDDTLDGGTGVDTISGGAGDDTYYVDNTFDQAIELLGEGEDTVLARATYTIGANIEHLILLGTSQINGTGNDLDNTIIGNDARNTLWGMAGNDVVDGGVGADRMIGGLGDDTYTVDNAEDTIQEFSGEGTDLVQASVSYILSSHVENLTLTGDEAINGRGNGLANVLRGNDAINVLDGGDGDDTLIGGEGADTLIGGTGSDTYYVDNIGDVVTDEAGAADKVFSGVTYTLTAGVENLELTGNESIHATGNNLNNIIIGNEGDNTLNGGVGADTLRGGDGNDVYIVDNINDVVVENGNVGTDKSFTYVVGNITIIVEGNRPLDIIESSVTYTLPNNVEVLRLTGTANIDAIGNDNINILAGNTGANTLRGGLGDDVYIVTDTRDRLIEVAGEGSDTVATILSYTLQDHFENLILIEGAGNINGIGNNADNIIWGNEGVNTMRGGRGDDVYLTGAGDLVIEENNEGTDTIIASVNWVLGNNIENLSLDEDAGGINGIGNTLNNSIYGNSANNTLDGGLGADFMAGGEGDDTYIVDNVGDTVQEASEAGLDTVISSISFVLGANVESLTLTGTANLNGSGNGEENTLIGNAGVNTLTGFGGDDVYYVQNTNDVVVENGAGGEDTVFSVVSYVLSANVEHLTLTGFVRINGTGNELDNTLIGNSADNTLSGMIGNDMIDGGIGADRLIGGIGDDTYIVDNAKDSIVENSGEGVDLVISTVAHKMASNVENLTLAQGAGNISGIGNELNNVMTGNEGRNSLVGGGGNDVLDGKEGADIMDGGDGDDTYYVDNTADVIKDKSGIDIVLSEVSYTLGTGLEHLYLVDGDINATGNTLNNTLIGTIGDNILNGGAGVDYMQGFDGSDTYYVDNAADIVVDGGVVEEDIDHVVATISYVLGSDIEHLTLTGKAVVNGTGNGLDNQITGNDAVNRLYGLAGDDTLDGGKGADSMFGGEGDDVYYVDSTGDVVSELFGEGYDTVYSIVNYALTAEIENLVLTGTKAKVATGNDLDNVLTGNTAANTLTGGLGNDTMDGGAGADRMVGGIGDDIYYIDNAKDIIVELAGEGIDTVYSSISYVLGADLEDLRLQGEANINAIGNAVNNDIYGNAGNNTLDGAAGIDYMVGGAGDDVYVVDNAGDTVLEFADEGNDTVRASVNYQLFVNIENLVLTGTADINGTGNVLDNVMTGNTGSNTLQGMDGNDTIDGGLGADVMIGGVGNDTYYVDNVLDIVTEVADEGIDSVISSTSYTLGFQVENLTLTGKIVSNGTGNVLNNVIIGNTAVNILDGGDGDDTLDGGAGADTLIGGLGDDTFYIDNKKDIIIENAGEGDDTAVVAFTYTLADNLENLTLLEGVKGKLNAFGNAGNNILTGNSGVNTINGYAGADTMIGGGGNDLYFVDDAGDVVIEYADEGVDVVNAAVSFALGANIETLILTGTANLNGTGNALNNTITGNAGDNTLDGGAGADTLDGGAGNDTYIVDNAGDVLKDRSGIDHVIASVSWTLASGFENVTLSGTADINATGNSAVNILTGNDGNNTLDGGSGNDTLIGGFGADRLIGGAGSDTLIGGDGDDIYVIDTLGDMIIENANEGLDTVESSITYTLGANLENLVMAGTSGIHGTGNALDNVITGNRGNNTLSGGDGNDTLEGGAGNDILLGGNGDDILYGQDGTDTMTGDAGADTFVFEAASAYKARDTVTDFTAGDGDVLDLRDLLEMYDPLAHSLSDFVRIVDSGGNAILSVDRDGTGTAANFVAIATLQGVNGLNDVDALVLSGNILAS